MTGKCARCGPVRLRRKAQGGGRPARLVCAQIKVEERRHRPDRRPGRHGLSTAQARAVREGKACALCGSGENLRLDHDHQSGHRRGVLCHGCNTGLGYFRDDPDLLERAAAYVRETAPDQR